MILWLDAQLPPSLAAWLTTQFNVEAIAVRELNLRDSTDEQIFAAAKTAGVIVITKDSDFVGLLERYGPPPQIVWLTIGNTSNAVLKQLFAATWKNAQELLQNGEALVEISGP